MKNTTEIDGAVNVAQIKAGDVIKNYPTMCLILGEDQKKGSPRERQIERWEGIFKFDKNGHKFVITEIYKEPIPKVDLKSDGNNSKYAKYTPLLLLDYLINDALGQLELYDEIDAIDLYNKDLNKILGLCNEKFKEDDELYSTPFKDNKISESDKDNFYQRAYGKMNQIIESTIKGIAKKFNFIEVKNTYKVSETINNKTIQRTATDEEVVVIDEVKKDTLHRFGAKTMFEIYARHKQKAFYAAIDEILLEKLNLTSTYKVYEFKLTGDMVDLKNKYSLTEEKREEYIHITNNLVREYLDNKAEKKFAKNEANVEIYNANIQAQRKAMLANAKPKTEKKRTGFTPPLFVMIPEDCMKVYKNHNDYVKNQKYLSELLIRLE